MKNKCNLFFFFLVLTVESQSQVINSPDTVALEPAQKKMFNCFSNGDAATFAEITGSDYITINADGTYMNKAGALDLLPKFKGSTNEIIQQETRFYGTIALTTGRVKFYFKSILVADTYFTQTWIWRDSKWYFIGWQGTMTGKPKNYPVYITIILLLIAAGIVSLLRRFARKKNERRSR